MDPIARSAGTALVGAMATDAWHQARAATVAVWRRTRPDRADHIAAELESLRTQVLTAREHHDPDTEQALAGAWRLHLQQLVDAHPAFADELRRLLDDHLNPALAAHERTRHEQARRDGAPYGGAPYGGMPYAGGRHDGAQYRGIQYEQA
ncbi:hypothetical protein [Streptomyces odontomachi]|uniref:hypothetical protein n=1 Tax=Streptomyces odontomachi TaxID=2944940 RepID=UPI00210AD682|nr:hypothetical protein [Streptomyces sp. ODS25]